MLSLFLAVVAAFLHFTTALPTPDVRTRSPQAVPQYVLDYAPLVWMDPEEDFFPTDIATFLDNVNVMKDGKIVPDAPAPLTLDNLDALSNLGKKVFLATKDDFATGPQWIKGVVPDAEGRAGDTTSSAIVIQDRGDGSLDAFYFYFYAYNRGNTVLGQELGNHVGDWEHTMVRFKDGKPTTAWLSAHAGGGAFKYSALEKQGDRAVVYSSRGSHANYATSGTHDHTIPGFPLLFGPLLDFTGKGKLWDPVKNAAKFTVSFAEGTKKDDSSSPTFAPYDEGSPTQWLSFLGYWGDDQLPKSDKRQKDFAGFKKYSGGPTGPYDKKLNRSKTCPKPDGLCVEWEFLPPGS